MEIVLPIVRPIVRSIDSGRGSAVAVPPPSGALEIDTFQVLIDGFPIIFS